MSHKPVRQDYIAKIRYTNNLPPPPLNPKYIEYNTTNPISPKVEAEQLLSSLFRKENFQNLLGRIDDFSGLELNLLNNAGFFAGDSTVVGQLSKNGQPVHLHPKDRALLRDAGIGKINKSEPGVSFLRRTEYISERSLPKAAHSVTAHTEEVKVNEKLKNNESHSLDADAQLNAVEETFTAANSTLLDVSSLKHPRKRHLKAVDAWPLLPDTQMMDNVLMNLRFLGSASIDRELKDLKRKRGTAFNEKFERQKQESSIFKPINSEDGEWMSMFEVNDISQAEQVHQKLNSTAPEQPINLLDLDDESASNYNFKFVHNYDMQYQEYPEVNQELAIKFIPDDEHKDTKAPTKKRKVAYYLPVTGKIELRKHRLSTNSEINKFVKERTYDEVAFKLREPSTNELKEMDRARSEFDPMEYEGDDDDEEEEEEDDDEEELEDGEGYEERGEQEELESRQGRSNGNAESEADQESVDGKVQHDREDAENEEGESHNEDF